MPPPTPPPVKKTSTNRSCLFAGLGCGLVLVIITAVVLALVARACRPGPPMELERFVESADIGVVHLTDTRKDPGMQAMLRHLILTFQELSRQQSAGDMPEALRWLQDMQSKQSASQNFSWMSLPEALLVLHSYDETDGPDYTGIVNLRTMPTMSATMVSFLLKQMVSEDGDESDSYRGIPTSQSEDHVMAYARKVLMMTAQSDRIETTIDRFLDTTEEEPPPHAVFSDTASVLPDGDLRAVFTNRNNFLSEYLALFRVENEDRGPGDFGHDVESLQLDADLVSDDQINLGWQLDCATPEAAAAWSRRWETVLITQQELLSMQDLDLTFSIPPPADSASRGRVELTGLKAWLAATLADQLEPELDPATMGLEREATEVEIPELSGEIP